VERATLYADRAKPRSAPFRALRTPHFLLEVNGEARDGDPGDGDPGDGEEPALLTLWDVKADPRELSPLRDAVTDEMAARLATLVDAWVAEQEALVSRLGERDLAPADDVDRERLEALGYLGDDGR
jgi:hypothetical protein